MEHDPIIRRYKPYIVGFIILTAIALVVRALL